MLSILIYSTKSVDNLRRTLTNISQTAKYPVEVEILVITHTEDIDTWTAVESLNLRTDTWVVTSRQDPKHYLEEIYKEAARLCIGDLLLMIPDDMYNFSKNWDQKLSDGPGEFEDKLGIVLTNNIYWIVDRKRFIDGPE